MLPEDDLSWSILQGDVLDGLRELAADSVQCVVTSPPYWGLRDYGVVGQIGLESSPDEHIARLVEVFREVRRVLRPDGVLWCNYGDAYASSPNGGQGQGGIQATRAVGRSGVREGLVDKRVGGLKPKDLIGLPWWLAFALRADGWWLRSDIVWHKPNPMPESCRDRPTRAHEYVFLLTKAERYFYDREPIREEPKPWNGGKCVAPDAARGTVGANGYKQNAREYGEIKGANARTVWTINPQPTPEAHFATFPEALAERCILAGTSAHGACAECGAPWERIVEQGDPDIEHQRACGGDASGGYSGTAQKDYDAARAENPSAVKARILAGMRERRTTGWRPTCACGTDAVRPCLVLDPFAGSGTTLLVAERLGRDSVGCELNPEYVAIAERRIRAADPMQPQPVAPGKVQRSLFDAAGA